MVQEKNKKGLIGKIIKWIGVVFLLILISLIIVPIIFKDEIKDYAFTEVNKTLLADVDLGDFDLTFISTFPNMTIKLNDAKITGRDRFEGVELVNVKEFSAHVNFWSVVSGDAVEINAIHIIEPSFDVRVLKNGLANYDIVKPDSVKTPEEVAEPSKFKLSLKEYSIQNADIRYEDKQGDMFTQLMNLSHFGKGDLTSDVIDFETETTIDAFTFDMEGVSYMNEVKTKAVANLLMEFDGDNSKYTLKENVFELNDLKFSIDGFYEMLSGYDNMDLKINASKATFKDFLSLIPTFYQSGYEDMIADGNLSFNCELKGKMDDVNMPGWDFNLNVDKAKIKYPDLPGSISNIQLVADSKFVGGANMDKMTLDISKFHADFVGNTIDATLKMRNVMTDPFIDSKILAKIDLSTLGKVMPMAEGESYNGKLNADITLRGKSSSLEKEDYEAFTAEGTLLLEEMLYVSKDLPSLVSIHSMLLRFSPQDLSLEKLDAEMGKSDFQMNGSIDNYLAYALKDETLKGDFLFTSRNLDLDELMGTTSEEEVVDSSSVESSDPVVIPGNIDFRLKTDLLNVKYDGLEFKNVKGAVKLKDQVASLDNLTMQGLGGTIGLAGDFSTVDEQEPKIIFSYDLKGIDIKALSDNFLTIEKLAPIAKHATGKISTSFSMNSSLTPNLDPIYSTLNGEGDLFTQMVSISGYEPLVKIGNALKMDNLSNQTINDLKTFFSFKDGKLSLTPFDVKLGGIVTNISGSTTFEQVIDYALKMNIPKDKIPASMLKTVEDQIKRVNSLVPNLNLDVLPAMIPVKLKVLGTVTNPKVTTDFKEAIMAASGNVKGNIKEKGKELVGKGIDSVKAVIDNTIEDAKKELEKKKQALLADAQKQADKIKVEGKKAADLARKEGKKQAEALIAEAGGNPIKKKAAEIAGNKLIQSANKNADKIENEANSKADAVMVAAREKADKLK
ncbi:hypothetical protein N9E20_02305 [Crocinitomicaceae bacterium]|nr:hypothetical protein [Crocinitomicaceae bacterium]